MPNSYFMFKQFIVQQDRCAMKVCTDSCILGAWFAEKIPRYASILDVGSGTGLLMLMLAQKTVGPVDGIEIDLPAFTQLKENISASKWNDRMTAFPGDVRSWSFAEKYDFIIANPPFYEANLMSDSPGKNIAKHGRELNLEELIQVIERNLKPSGNFGVLLPFSRGDYFEELALRQHFYVMEKLHIRQTPDHDFFRTIIQFSLHDEGEPGIFEMSIQDEKKEYSPEFRELIKDYYLNL